MERNNFSSPHFKSYLFVGRSITVFGDQLILFTIPLIALKYGGLSASGMTFLTEWLVRIICLPFLGILLEKYSPIYVLFNSDLLRVISAITIFISLFLSIHDSYFFILLLIFSGLSGICGSVSFLSLEKVILLSTSKESLPKANASLQFFESLSRVLSPIICAYFISFIDIKFFFIGIVCFFSFSCACFFVLRDSITSCYVQSKKSITQNLINLKFNFKNTLLLIFNTKRLLKLIILTATVNFIFGIANGVNVGIVKNVFHQPDSSFAILNSLSGVGTILGAFATTQLIKLVNINRIGLLATIFISLFGLIMSIAPSFILYSLCWAGVGACLMAFNTFIRSERAHLIPKNVFASALGFIMCFNQMSLPLSGALISILASEEKIRYVMLIASVLTVCILVVFIRDKVNVENILKKQEES